MVKNNPFQNSNPKQKSATHLASHNQAPAKPTLIKHAVLLSLPGLEKITCLYFTTMTSIHAEAIPNCEAETFLKAYQNVFATLIRAGLHPQLHHLDNKCSAALNDFFVEKTLTFNWPHQECIGQMQQNEPSVH
jgi:hypothetical protein